MSKKNIKRLDKKTSHAAPKTGNKLFGYLLGTAVVLGVIAFMALGGGMLMSVFGFQFDSAWSVILFFLAASAISYPLVRLVTQIPRILCVQGRITKAPAVAMYIAFGTAATALSFFILDLLMDHISASASAILVISTLLALPGAKDVDQRPQ